MGDYNMKPILLIGMMGSGKTTIGKGLSEELSLSWADTDQYIEQQTQNSISHLFQQHGENYFRQLETQALQSLITRAEIISTGGGIIITPANRKILKNQATVIYLKANINTLATRIDPSDRPLLQNEDLKDKFATLYHQRSKWYEECAHYMIETDLLTIGDVIATIKNLLTA